MGLANGSAQIESKQESRAVNPFSLYGLAGAGLAFRPVIPAKAGIQTVEAKFATRNQVQTAIIGSLPPSWTYRGRFTEIRNESRATNPFPLHGGRLGWGSRGRPARVPAANKSTPIRPLRAGRLGEKPTKSTDASLYKGSAAKPTAALRS